MRLLMRKLQSAETRTGLLQQKLDARAQDYDTLYFTHQKMKQDMEEQRSLLFVLSHIFSIVFVMAVVEVCVGQLWSTWSTFPAKIQAYGRQDLWFAFVSLS